MDVDLTCPLCKGSGNRAYAQEYPCINCHGTRRRPPTLAEWDALRAERDELDGIVSAYHDATGCLPEDASALRAERDRCYSALMDAAWALERITSQSPGVLRLPHWIGADLAECDRALKAARAALDARDCTCSTRTTTHEGHLVHADDCPQAPVLCPTCQGIPPDDLGYQDTCPTCHGEPTPT